MMEQIQRQIMTTLQDIEREEGVRILYACESGSRAWGFASRDSDYDVRFLYVRPLEQYLSLAPARDVIERPITDELDVNGWDLYKALGLLRKSNPPLLEWLQSPVVYQERYSIAERIREHGAEHFSARSCLYHYLHMARGNFRDYLQGEEVRLKKYFYVLRPVLACGWIERYGVMPPIRFDELVSGLLPDSGELRKEVQRLLERKQAGDELDSERRIDVLNGYLEERIAYYEKLAAALPAADGCTVEALDQLFRMMLSEAWGNKLHI